MSRTDTRDRKERRRINRDRWARVFPHQPYIDDPEDRTNYLLDVIEQPNYEDELYDVQGLR